MAPPFAAEPQRARWAALACVALTATLAQTALVTFSPIASVAADLYGISINALNWLLLAKPILHIPATTMAAYLTKNRQLKPVLLFTTALALVGTTLRCVSLLSTPAPTGSDSVLAATALFAGTVLIALVPPLIWACVPAMAIVWFPVGQRTLACAFVRPRPPAVFKRMGAKSLVFLHSCSFSLCAACHSPYPSRCKLRS